MASPEEFIGRRVGRFMITSHLASGGMAELYIARQEAVGGFEKDLVLKMLQERYAGNPRVVGMFLDEARLAARLNHQNVVHVYDVDEAAGLHYIAMEYIHGETVTDIVRRSIARGGFLPLEHALQIVADTAAGLAYAHERRDAEGHVTRIIHRDVSPSNILVTYEGITKIVDFGIARVQDQIREESGMRPGKVSYMSPEQVRGEGADHRSDIFSLGIILYEITVGRRLWRGTPEEVLRRILGEQIPPPTYVRRDYPPALELIVMKALEKRASDRHQSAADLQHELQEFMEEAGLKSGPRRLAQYMKDLFASDEKAAEGARPGTGGDDESGQAEPVAPEGEEGEELDFDRRAPLMMRVEARSGERREGDSGRAPVPPLGAEVRDDGSGPARRGPILSPSAAAPPGKGGGGMDASRSTSPSPADGSVSASVSVGSRDEASAATAAAASPGSRDEAAASAASPASAAPPPAGPVPAGSPPVVAPEGPRAAGAEPASAVPRAGGGWLRWLVLAALVGAGIVVFLSTR